MLVPERGDPTIKIGLFMLRCIQTLWIICLLVSSQALSMLTVGAFFSKATFCTLLTRHSEPNAWGGSIIRIYRSPLRMYVLPDGSDQD